MEKRIVIAGTRDFTDYEAAKEYIDSCIKNIKKNYEIIILCGGCKGADSLGERYASEKGFSVEYYLPDWKKYKKAAGPKRNLQMAQDCDFVICFWDGKSHGTNSMISYAKKMEKPLFLKMI